MTATLEAPIYGRTIGHLRALGAAGVGINVNERIFALAMLDADEPMTLGEAAAITGISRAAMTSMADRMELEGMIKRIASMEDRRVTNVELTARGRKKALAALS